MKQGRGVNWIDTGVLIPGAGAPVAAATVLTEGGTITYAGPAAGLGPGAPARADVHVPAVMPGMWDCHCHLYGVRRFSLDDMLITPVPTAAARAAKDAEAAVQAEAVTASGPRTLGPQAPRSGQLRPGFDADLLTLSRNPLEDLSVLADPKEITHVWRRGQLVKHPVAP